MGTRLHTAIHLVSFLHGITLTTVRSGTQPLRIIGSVPVTGTKIIQHHKCLGGTRKLSNSSIVHTWSVSPAAMAGVTGFHFFREPLASPIHRRNNRTCYI